MAINSAQAIWKYSQLQCLLDLPVCLAFSSGTNAILLLIGGANHIKPILTVLCVAGRSASRTTRSTTSFT